VCKPSVRGEEAGYAAILTLISVVITLHPKMEITDSLHSI
jgi:hypothetical protein